MIKMNLKFQAVDGFTLNEMMLYEDELLSNVNAKYIKKLILEQVDLGTLQKSPGMQES